MISSTLNITHWILCVILSMSALFPCRKIKQLSFIIISIILASWIVFDRCILWDIQKSFDPNFKPTNDSTSNKLGIDHDTTNLIMGTVIYVNYFMLGKQIGYAKETINAILIYMLLNRQYVHRGNDKLSKYM